MTRAVPTKDKDRGPKLTVAVLGLLVFVPYQGWIVSVLWGWFAAPVVGFQLGAFQVAGLLVTRDVIRGPIEPPPTLERLIEETVKDTSNMTLCLACGALYAWMMG